MNITQRKQLFFFWIDNSTLFLIEKPNTNTEEQWKQLGRATHTHSKRKEKKMTEPHVVKCWIKLYLNCHNEYRMYSLKKMDVKFNDKKWKEITANIKSG